MMLNLYSTGTHAVQPGSIYTALACNGAQPFTERPYQPFCLMDLPDGTLASISPGGILLTMPEMGNLVYDFAICETIHVTKETGSLLARGVFPRNRESLAFAHLSKQVRAEFLPLYMGRTTIRLAPEELPSYVDDQSSGEIQKRIGNFAVDIPIPASWLSDYIDLYPTFDIVRKSSHLMVHFIGSGNGEDDCRAFMVNAITACRRPGWKNMLILDKIYKIEMDVSVKMVILRKLLDKHDDQENDADDSALVERLGLTDIRWYTTIVIRHRTSDDI